MSGAVTEPVPLIQDLAGGTTDLRELHMWDDAFGRWLAFDDAMDGQVPASQDMPSWRVVRVAPGCVYKTWRLILAEGE